MNPITVIIPVWNAYQYTEKCLSLLVPHKNHFDAIIMIDNGSADRTRDVLVKAEKDLGNKLKVIVNKQNLGFAKAVNQGIKARVEGSDVVILNNDVEITTENFFPMFRRKAYELLNCSALIPKQLGSDGRFLCGPSFTLPVSKIGFSYGNEIDVNQFAGDVKADVVMFACVYIKNEAIEAIGLLDEEFFSYAEDSDWCVRAEQAGFERWYAGSLIVTHHHNVTTAVNKINLGEMQARSVAHFAKKHEKHFEERYEGREIMVQGATGFPSGYSRMTEAIIRGLENNPDPFKVRYGFLYGVSKFERQSSNRFIEDIKGREAKRNIPQLLIGQGDVFYKNSGSPSIGYSMMDCDRWPREWVDQANELDELWVPTERGKRDMVESGIKKPIWICPIGVDGQYFNPDITPLVDICHLKFRRPVNFLTVLEWGERKQPELMLNAWHKAFWNNPDVALYVKLINSDPSVNVQEAVNRIQINNAGSRAQIRFITPPDFNGFAIDDHLLGSLYRSFDAYITTSAGEGFGMTEVEALACGLPVMCGNRFGYLAENPYHSGSVLNFDSVMAPVTPDKCKCNYYWEGQWAEPVFDSVVENMKYMAENIEDMKRKAVEGSLSIRRALSWETVIEGIKNHLIAIIGDKR